MSLGLDEIITIIKKTDLYQRNKTKYLSQGTNPYFGAFLRREKALVCNKHCNNVKSTQLKWMIENDFLGKEKPLTTCSQEHSGGG